MLHTENSTLALCIPAHNASGFIRRLLDSAEAQTVPFDEIWVYDDASADDTGKIAAEAGARVVRGERNIGCSRGKNVLAGKCRSHWLHFHDADDALEPNFVEVARGWMNRAASPDVVFFAYRAFDHDKGNLVGQRTFDVAALENDPIGYCLANQINPFCGIYKRDPFLAAGGWDEDPEVLQSEDQAGHLRLAAASLRFSAENTFTVRNFMREGSMTTSNPAGAQRSTYALLAKAVDMVASKYWPVISRRLWEVAGSSAAYLDWENANRAAILARRIQPQGAIPGKLWFRALAQVSPRLALRWREGLIRRLRPALRRASIYNPPLSRP